MSTDRKLRVLSIDAWGNADDGWDWNQWHVVGHVSHSDVDGKSDDDLIALFISEGYASEYARSGARIDDDGTNIVLIDSESGEPLYAIEYASDDE